MGDVVSLNEARATRHPRINLYCRIVNEQGDDFDFAEFVEGDFEGIKAFASFGVGYTRKKNSFNPIDHLAATYFRRLIHSAREQGTSSPRTYEKLCNFSRCLLRYCQESGSYYCFRDNDG